MGYRLMSRSRTPVRSMKLRLRMSLSLLLMLAGCGSRYLAGEDRNQLGSLPDTVFSFVVVDTSGTAVVPIDHSGSCGSNCWIAPLPFPDVFRGVLNLFSKTDYVVTDRDPNLGLIRAIAQRGSVLGHADVEYNAFLEPVTGKPDATRVELNIRGWPGGYGKGKPVFPKDSRYHDEFFVAMFRRLSRTDFRVPANPEEDSKSAITPPDVPR